MQLQQNISICWWVLSEPTLLCIFNLSMKRRLTNKQLMSHQAQSRLLPIHSLIFWNASFFRQIIFITSYSFPFNWLATGSSSFCFFANFTLCWYINHLTVISCNSSAQYFAGSAPWIHAAKSMRMHGFRNYEAADWIVTISCLAFIKSLK